MAKYKVTLSVYAAPEETVYECEAEDEDDAIDQAISQAEEEGYDLADVVDTEKEDE